MDAGPFRAAAPAFAKAFPNVKIVAATLREPTTAGRNDWGAVAWADGRMIETGVRRDLEILDRVGGGDGFVSGLAWALMDGRDLQAALDWGAAHGALAMTTPGDSSMASKSEVEALLAGAGARTVR